MKTLFITVLSLFSFSSFACHLTMETSASAKWTINTKTNTGSVSLYSNGIGFNGNNNCSVEQQRSIINATFSSKGIRIGEQTQKFSGNREDSVKEIQEIYEAALNEMIRGDFPESSEIAPEVKLKSLSCQKIKKQVSCSAEFETTSSIDLN